MPAAVSEAASGRSLAAYPIHLGTAAGAQAQSAFAPDERAMQWYSDYAERTAGDGRGARLVSMFRFTENWSTWEMHPHGAEVVLCTQGRMVLIQEHRDGRLEQVALAEGQYAINPPGVWHTADIAGEATAVFITAGTDTQNRPR